jgi:hypothetical protein
VRRAAFTVTLNRSCLRSVTYVSKFCKPLDFKQSDYMTTSAVFEIVHARDAVAYLSIPPAQVFSSYFLLFVTWWPQLLFL